MKLGAIDIGSNAVRLLVADVVYSNNANKIQDIVVSRVKLYRLPVRLGADVFKKGEVGVALVQKLCKAMLAFKTIMDIYEVEDYRAYATSALREAENGEAVVEAVFKNTGVKIKLISGQEEASIILSNKVDNFIDRRFNHLLVDVGGGSTEISLLARNGGGVSISKSFKIGTLRVLEKKDSDKQWQKMEEWLEKNIVPAVPLSVIGSGGNINSIFKRSHHPDDYPLYYSHLKAERNLLAALSIEERVILQEMSEDRADVIVPALDIFLFIMEKVGIQQVVVPKVGLVDGIIRSLYIDRKK